MLFSELYKIMVNKVNFVGFRGADRPNRPHLDATLLAWPVKQGGDKKVFTCLNTKGYLRQLSSAKICVIQLELE